METLQDYGIVLRNQNSGNHKTKCPECKDSRKAQNKHDTPLSVTIKSGKVVWNCHNCGWAGALSDNVKREEYKDHKRPDISDNSGNRPKSLIEYFEKRGISPQTLAALFIYRDEVWTGDGTRPAIVFPYYVNKELLNLKYRTPDKTFRQTAGAERTLYNIDRVQWRWETTEIKEVIFVEGEMDVATLFECGFQHTTSLPDGAPKEAKFDPDDKRFTALQNSAWLSEATKVVIGTDMDDPGEALALELVHRFGKDVCWRVDWSPYKDANEMLMGAGAEAVQDALDEASPYPIEGLHDVNKYEMEVIDIYHGRVQRPISTGFAFLDEIYKIMPGTFQVVTGIPNHGKSNFVDQLTMNLAENERWQFAVFSPEHSPAQHIRRLAEKRLRKPFDIGLNERMTEDELNAAMKFMDSHYHFIQTQEVPDIVWILEKAKAAIYRYGVKGIVIDPYNEVNSERPAGLREDEHIRELISKCKHFCRTYDVVMWMVAHPAKLRRDPASGEIPPPTLYDVSGAAHWNNMADVGLVIHRDFNAGQTIVHTRKIREQGLYGQIGEKKFVFNNTKRIYEESLPDMGNYRRPYGEVD